MRHVTLKTCSDEYDSKPGFALVGTDCNADGYAADRDGILIAHDLLEHVNGPGEIGSVWDELEALGAIWQVRARHGDLLNNRPAYSATAYNMPYQIAGDVTRMFGEWGWRENYYEGPGSLREGSRPIPEMESDFAATLEIARKDIPGEHIRDVGGEEREAELREMIEPYLALALRRMRIGYRKARRRYGDGYRGADQFVSVRDAIKEASAWVEVEGQRFRLSYGDGRAVCRPLDDEGRAYDL